MKHCIILGDRSDIAKSLEVHLVADGWNITGWNRTTPPKYLNRYFPQWDLVLCAIGTVAPVGHWSTVSTEDWRKSVESNCILPISLLRACWHQHNPNASICFLAGANPNKAGPNYSGYYTGKMALLKAIETIDAETPDAKFFALAPGVVFTKIHQPTYDSGIINPGLEEKKKVGSVPIEKIYECLKWCISMSKEAVGGRNICVSDKIGCQLEWALQANSSMFKLRRIE